MEIDKKWYFPKEQLANSPSRKCGYDAEKELLCRLKAADFIHDLGQRLKVSQLCINTAIVYMHRFYLFHSFTSFHRNEMAAAALYLAAKVEEQPRKLEHVVKAAQTCLGRDGAECTAAQVRELGFNERALLMTLGFEVGVEHPHRHVVSGCETAAAGDRELAKRAYYVASASLRTTDMCVRHPPAVVACFCIHAAGERLRRPIPDGGDGRPWFWHIDRTVTAELLEELTAEFTLAEKRLRPERTSGHRGGENDPGRDGTTLSAGPRQPATQRPPGEGDWTKRDGEIVPSNRHPLPDPALKRRSPPMRSGPSSYGPPPVGMYESGPGTGQSTGGHWTSAPFRIPTSGSGGDKTLSDALMPPPPTVPPRHAKPQMRPPGALTRRPDLRHRISHRENPADKNNNGSDNHHRSGHSENGSHGARQAGSGRSAGNPLSLINDSYKMGNLIKIEGPIKSKTKTEPYVDDSCRMPPAAPLPRPHPVAGQSSADGQGKTKPPPRPDSPTRITMPVLPAFSPLSPPPCGRTAGNGPGPRLIPLMPRLEAMTGFRSLDPRIDAVKLPGTPHGDVHRGKRLGKNFDVNCNKPELKPLLAARCPVSVVDTADGKPSATTQAPVETVDLMKREHEKKKRYKKHKKHKVKDPERKMENEKDKHEGKREREGAKNEEKERRRGDPAPIMISIPMNKINIQEIEKIKQNRLKVEIPKGGGKDPVGRPKSSTCLKTDIRPNKDSKSSSSDRRNSSKKRERSFGDESRQSQPAKHAKTDDLPLG